MRFSEAWLREYVNPLISTDRMVAQLTMAGLEVDGVEPVAGVFSGVVVAEVLEVSAHPKADRLRICKVNAGQAEELTIVCGAPNVAAGMKVPLATLGASLPGGLEIKASELRGVASFGMLCSAKELGIDDPQTGLMELPQDAPVGSDLRDYLNLDDSVFEVDLTPNRADCLSVQGIAREVALLNGLDWSVPNAPVNAVKAQDEIKIEVLEPAVCPRYLGRLIKGLNPSAQTPLWMRERLRRSGIRSLGPIVDVTNYILLDLGQPLHAFDAAKLEGGIKVRFGVPGEKLMLLNDQEITLDPDVLVIADDCKPLALAGVMGGSSSAVSDATTDILLECAFFAPVNIMGKARRYGLSTDSSHRFERGVDACMQQRAIERASELLIEIAGGKLCPVVEALSESNLPAKQPILLRQERLKKLLGVDIAAAQVEGFLTRLGMKLEKLPEGWRVAPPSFRFDISIEADLIEEIGRVYGYDNIPKRRPTARMELQAESEALLDVERIKDVLVDRGYQEAITYSFVDAAKQALIDPDNQGLALKNPISSELAVMRTGLWCGLLDAAIRNANRQQVRVRLFEAGLKFGYPHVQQAGQSFDFKQIVQKKSLAGLVMGSALPEQWAEKQRSVDFYDLKADIEALLRLCGHDLSVSFAPCKHPALHPGQSAQIFLKNEIVGCMGMLHPKLESELGFETSVFLFELDQDVLLKRDIARFQSLSKFPQVRRDIAIIVDEAVSASQLIECVKHENNALLRQTLIFDVYRGQGIDSGKKSIAMGFLLQDDAETLTDSRVEEFIAQILGRLKIEFNAKLRD